MNIDQCDVRGYTAWSFLDNFEWMSGYSEHFGLHYVNFSDPDRPRTPKASASYFTSIIETNGFLRPVPNVQTTAERLSTPPKEISFRHAPTGSAGTLTSGSLTVIVFLLMFLLF